MSEPTIPEWINSISAAVGALAVVVGLLGANRTIQVNRRSARELRRSQVAEELIAISLSIEDALRDIRNPFDSIPVDKVSDKKYLYQRRYERVARYNELFKKLRDAQIRVRAVIGDTAVDEAVEVLFSARNRVIIAIESLAEFAAEKTAEFDREERKSRIALRRDAYGSFSAQDSLGNSIQEAVKVVEKNLSSVARLNTE